MALAYAGFAGAGRQSDAAHTGVGMDTDGAAASFHRSYAAALGSQGLPFDCNDVAMD